MSFENYCWRFPARRFDWPLRMASSRSKPRGLGTACGKFVSSSDCRARSGPWSVARAKSRAKQEFSQQNLVEAVGQEVVERCGLLKTVTSIEAQTARVEARRADPEIARLVPQGLPLEPGEERSPDPSVLEFRQQRQ